MASDAWNAHPGLLDNDGDGIDDRMADYFDATQPGWRSDAEHMDRLRGLSADPRGLEHWIDGRSPENAPPGGTASDADYGRAMAWALRGAIPSREEMTYTPVGYDPTMLPDTALTEARPDLEAVAAQQQALEGLSGQLRGPDRAAQAGLAQTQRGAIQGSREGLRGNLAQSVLGYGSDRTGRTLGLTQSLGRLGGVRRGQAFGEAIGRAGAQDEVARARADALNEARMRLFQEQQRAAIDNSRIASRRAGMGLQTTEMEAGMRDVSEQRRREAQAQAAERAAQERGQLIEAGTETVKALAAADDDEEERRPRGASSGARAGYGGGY